MHMSSEKIDPPAPAPEEPAIMRAARMIKELHIEHIAKMNTGFVFYKKLDDGSTVDCNEEMREACMQQIERCNKIMAAASRVSPDMVESVVKALEGVHEQTLISLNVPLEEPLPEIGNYDHKA